MNAFFSKQVAGHPIVLGSIAFVAMIALGSGFYYYEGTRAPATLTTTDTSAAAQTVTGSGTVEPSQNPDLAFVSGGRVANVSVTVGQSVGRGALLASLDTASLGASLAQAQANLKGAQARLSQMQAGPRDTDLAVRQTAVTQAQQTLTNLYQNVPSDIADAYSSTLSAVHADTDTLFNNPDSSNPSLVFQTSGSNASGVTASGRIAANAELTTWKSEALSPGVDQDSLDASISASVGHLLIVRNFANTLTEALGSALTSQSFPQSSITAGNASVAALRGAASASLGKLQADQQQIASAKLAIAAAQDALSQLQAGSTPQDIAAQQASVDAASANVSAAEAAIGNAIITAPFSGTVSAVRVKKGDIIPPNTVAVSLNPQSALQIEVYFSEIDAAKIASGAPATVTVDAYGDTKPFAATVISIDRSPTMQNGVPAYKATLQFTEDNPLISSGMTANVSITPAKK